MDRFRIFTWHIHSSYLYYLSQGPFDILIPIATGGKQGYGGKGTTYPFGDNVCEVPMENVRDQKFDCILFQTKQNFFVDQHEMLSEAQRQLPRIYLEHDPPDNHPTDTVHPLADENIIIVHVTAFNALMWQNHNRIVRVIEHGVTKPQIKYSGEWDKGVAIINNLHDGGRQMGTDILKKVKQEVPIDLIGKGSDAYGGLGEIPHTDLPAAISKYRFFFNPLRYSSLGLAVCEAMMLGMPIVALATTEYATTVRDGVSGFIHTDVDYLIEKMKLLINRPALAFALGSEAAREATERFNIERFTAQWQNIFTIAITNDPGQTEEVMPVRSNIVL